MSLKVGDTVEGHRIEQYLGEDWPQTDEACVASRRRLRRTPAAAPLRGVKPPS